MTKIFVVSEYVYSAQNSTGYFWSKVIDKIGQDFCGISVVAPSPSQQGCKKSEFESVRYIEFSSRKFDKSKLSSRLIGQIHQCMGFSRYILLHARRGDVVLSGTNPALLLFLIPVMKFFINFRWCLLVHDVFPENLVPAGVLREKSLSYRLSRKFFNRIYSCADHLVVIGRDMKELISEKTGSDAKITVIQNWVSDQDVVPGSRKTSEVLGRLGWLDKIVFQFFGNIGRVQGVDNVLAAISLVKSSKAAFLFIGDGSAARTVNEYAEKKTNKNVAYIGPLDQSQKNLGLTACDVALVTLEKGMLGLGVPSKAYFSMAADKPLLAVMDDRAEVSLMINEEAIGWSCAPNDPAALAALIDNICQADISNMHGHPRKVLQQKYSESAALDKFVACMKSVMDDKQ